MGKHVVTREICAAVKEMTEAGIKASRIAVLLKISRATVYRIKHYGYDFETYTNSIRYTYKMQQEAIQPEPEPQELPFHTQATIKDLIEENMDEIRKKLDRLYDMLEEKQPAILSTRLFSRKKK